MSQRDPQVRIRHMLDYAREALEMAKGRNRMDLESDRMFFLALTRLVELLGEAANQVPSEIQTKYANVPWREITGMRNRLIHGYSDIDLDILWTTILEDLPPLIADIEKIDQSD